MKKKNINMFMAVVVFLTVFVGLAEGGWPEAAKLVDPNGADYDYFGVSVSVSGDNAIVGACWDDDYGNDSGSAFIFKRDGTAWIQQAKLTASDIAEEYQFGSSVCINGDYAIVGACGEANYRGSAYIFKCDGSSWLEQAKLTASDGAAEDGFGSRVSIDGDYAVVSSCHDDDNGNNSGSAYIFKRDGIIWKQQAKLTASDGAIEDEFGISVSISGDYVVAGSFNDGDNGSNSGSAYIFKRDGTAWTQQAKLTASDGSIYDYFGISVCIAGDYTIVGAYCDDHDEDDSGSAYIFKRNGTAWTEEAKLNASDGGGEDFFGVSVYIDGDYAIVGACGGNPGIGSAYIFKRDVAAWEEQVKLTASDGAFEDYFGTSVSIDGSFAIVGSYGDDAYRGSAYIFEKVCPSADLTGDCFVDIEDFMVMAEQWLTGEN